jgi:hypothetical protein
MKVALLISGLPRWVEKGFDNINKTLIAPNDPDIFIHTWNDLDGTLNYPINELYKPKLLKSENQKTWVNTHLELDRMMASHARSYARDKFVEMLYSSWYSIQQANLLKEQYRLENNIKYDYVIRGRFDLYFHQEIVCKNYPSNMLNISNKWLPDLEMTDDRFAFASNEIMNVYASGFNFLDVIQNKRNTIDGIFCGETLVYEVIQIANIKVNKINNLTCDNLSHLIAKGAV